jgi:hypothetical protein
MRFSTTAARGTCDMQEASLQLPRGHHFFLRFGYQGLLPWCSVRRSCEGEPQGRKQKKTSCEADHDGPVSVSCLVFPYICSTCNGMSAPHKLLRYCKSVCLGIISRLLFWPLTSFPGSRKREITAEVTGWRQASPVLADAPKFDAQG